MEISLHKVSEIMGGEYFGNKIEEKHEMVARDVGPKEKF